MPFRRVFRPLALGATLLLAIASARAPRVSPTPESGSETCPERGACPRCPAPARRAPDACTACPQVCQAVAARQVRLTLPSPSARERRRGDAKAPAATLSNRAATLRHEVLGASPPKPLLLATLRS